jgi:hypothetical protein
VQDAGAAVELGVGVVETAGEDAAGVDGAVTVAVVVVEVTALAADIVRGNIVINCECDNKRDNIDDIEVTNIRIAAPPAATD